MTSFSGWVEIFALATIVFVSFTTIFSAMNIMYPNDITMPKQYTDSMHGLVSTMKNTSEKITEQVDEGEFDFTSDLGLVWLTGGALLLFITKTVFTIISGQWIQVLFEALGLIGLENAGTYAMLIQAIFIICVGLYFMTILMKVKV